MSTFVRRDDPRGCQPGAMIVAAPMLADAPLDSLSPALGGVTVLVATQQAAAALGTAALKQVPVIVQLGARAVYLRGGTTVLELPDPRIPTLDAAIDSFTDALLAELSRRRLDAHAVERLSAYDWHRIIDRALCGSHCS